VTGFHGRAELCGHGVTVYLLPGMTRWQRKAVLRRLRMEASRGYGPALPLPQLAFALAVDRVRTALRITGGAVRLHPSQTLLPSAAAVALMAFFVLASAGGRMQLTPRAAGLDGLVSSGGNTAAASPFGHVAAERSFGPVTGRGAAAVVAGLPAGQWTVKPSALGRVVAAGQSERSGAARAAQTTGPQRQPGLRVEQACFGAMPGVGSGQAVQLACKATTPPPAGG
jgi:hypothetical protein